MVVVPIKFAQYSAQKMLTPTLGPASALAYETQYARSECGVRLTPKRLLIIRLSLVIHNLVSAVG